MVGSRLRPRYARVARVRARIRARELLGKFEHFHSPSRSVFLCVVFFCGLFRIVFFLGTASRPPLVATLEHFRKK
jgi:hypothetical protein